MKPSQISDPYKRLGLDRNATAEEIKKSYRRAAIIWHPDKNKDPNAKTEFRAIQEAYESITEPIPELLKEFREFREEFDKDINDMKRSLDVRLETLTIVLGNLRYNRPFNSVQEVHEFEKKLSTLSTLEQFLEKEIPHVGFMIYGIRNKFSDYFFH